MGKPTSKPDAAPVKVAVKWKTISALPEDMPTHLEKAAAEGWTVNSIVQDRRGNDHVAYLCRIG